LSVALGRAAPSGEGQHHLVGLAVADVLRASGATVIAIDDVQFVDQASADALVFAFRRLADTSIAILTARRSGAAGGLRLEPDRTLDIGPLSVGALGQVLRQRLDLTLPRPVMIRVHEAVAGNAFLALEIGRTLVDRDAFPGPAEPFPVTPDYEPLIRARLAQLSPASQQAVVVVAMTAEPRWNWIERVLGPGGDAALDEACRREILVAEGDRLRFTHPLYRSAAYFGAPPGERRALHRQLAEVAVDPVESAVHLAAAVTDPDPAVAATLADAGRLALARGAPAAAADLLEKASAIGSDTAAILVLAGKAAAAAGDADRAAALLHRAIGQAPTGPDRVTALLALGELVYATRPAEALDLLVSALDHTAGDAVLESTVHSHITGMADVDPAWAAKSAQRAAALLEQPGLVVDPDHLACALLERAYNYMLRGEAFSVADIERGLALRTGTGGSFIARRSGEAAERCLFHLGRLDDARALDEAEYQRLKDRGDFGLLPPLAQALSVLTQLAGDWTAARRYAYECLDYVAQGAHAWQDRAVLALSRLHAWNGDLAAARATAAPALEAQEAAGDRWEAAIFAALLGFVELSAPDPPASLGYLTRALAHADAVDVRLPSTFRFLGDLVEAAVLAGKLDVAVEVLTDRLEPVADRQQLPWAMAMAMRGRGLLLDAGGEHPAAIEWFDRAVAVFDRSLAMPFERARTLYLGAQVRRRAGQRRAARADLLAAADVFDRLGALAWRALAHAELARIGGRTATGSDLTWSERNVAGRAAAGRSNKEIAADLSVSIRTVESQLSAVYRKLGIRSRSQIADALSRLP
jgi:DNA-binding CsgD family transcriptional regulator